MQDERGGDGVCRNPICAFGWGHEKTRAPDITRGITDAKTVRDTKVCREPIVLG